MKIVKPYTTTLTDSSGGGTVKYFNNIISTNATDETVDEYDSATTYAINSEVKIEALKRKFVSKIDGNTDYPVGSINWVDMGALNSYSCFDTHIFSSTTSPDDLIIEIDTSLATKVGVLNIKGATSVIVEYTDTASSSDTTVETLSLRDYGVNSLYDYAYKPFTNKTQFIKNIDWSPSSTVKLTFPSNPELSIGMIVSGVEEESGVTLFGSSISQKDFSVVNTDDWGNTTFVPRNVAKVVNAKVVIDTVAIDRTMTLFDEIRASLNLFIGDERDKGIESLNIMGFVKDVEIPVSPTKSDFSIQIIGVI